MKNLFPRRYRIGSADPVRYRYMGGVTEEQCEKIFNQLETGIFKEGEKIFEKGDEPSHIHIVRKGKIGLMIIDQQINLLRRPW